jgi:hypothetical protein
MKWSLGLQKVLSKGIFAEKIAAELPGRRAKSLCASVPLWLGNF